MSRYHPPRPAASPYITPAGYAALQDELQALWVRRADVTRHLAAAAAEGDRSENAEYIYRKKELREIDRRIGYLQRRMPRLKVIGAVPEDAGRVYFGAWVTLESEDGREATYRIVGADEIDTAGGAISVDSPMARALLKRAVDEEVTVRTQAGEMRYVIVAVGYGAPG